MVARKYYKGKDGRVDVGSTELEVTQFGYGDEVDVESFASSLTDGKKVTVDGNSQASGDCQGKISEEQVLNDVLQSGDLVELKLYLTKSNSQNKKVYLHVPEARISNIQYTVDPNGGPASQFTFNWLSHGDYEYKAENA